MDENACLSYVTMPHLIPSTRYKYREGTKEEKAAATKIQAVRRGQSARRQGSKGEVKVKVQK